MKTYLREFDINIAKKIINNEIKGRIITRAGYNVNIVYWNLRNTLGLQIVAVINYRDYDTTEYYFLNGHLYNDGRETNSDLMLEIDVIQNKQFVDGDIVVSNDNEVIAIYNGRYVPEIEELPYYVALEDNVLHFRDNNKNINSGYGNINNYRFATETEKDKLFKKLEEYKENENSQLYIEIFS